MDTNKMREEFEVALIAMHVSTGLPKSTAIAMVEVKCNGQYASPSTMGAWWAWQSSRSAIEIELPAENPLGSGHGDHGGGRPSFEQHCAAECNFIIRDCRDAIHKAGIRTK